MDRLNHLVFVQYNSKLRNKKEKIKEKKNIDLLIASDANAVQGWLIDGGDDEQVDEQEASQLHRSPRVRALDDDFKSDTKKKMQSIKRISSLRVIMKKWLKPGIMSKRMSA